MKRIVIVGLLICACSQSILRADEASHKKTAAELLEVMQTEKMLDQMMDAMEGVMEQSFKALDLPAEGREASKAVQKETMEWFSEFFVWEQMRDLYVDIYVEVFTEPEIRELIEFYKSPLGQKLLKKMPALMQKSMQKTQALLQDKMPAFQKRLEKTITELEEKYKDK